MRRDVVAIMRQSKDISEALRPTWWKNPLAYWDWKRNHQPVDVSRAILKALRGDSEPLRKYGIAL